MPGINSFITVAVSLLAFSSRALATADGADSVVAARDLNFAADIAGATELTKRWNSHGKKCSANSQCHTDVQWARPSCNQWGRCTFKCLGNTVQVGDKCQKKAVKIRQCWRNRDCHTSDKHGSAVCWHGRCETQCDRGYHLWGGKCAKNENKCAKKVCLPVEDGYSTCSGGKCSYHCATYLGYTLFTNSKKTAYRCVNLENDADNCGAIGKVCKSGYNGKGYPYCSTGTCQLNCDGYKSKKTVNGRTYCSNA